ncbi:MAG: FHA domain-containing protein [Myxococcota bacterium]|nr:FHA domain-containing protein [Myxococcota bacterium]
MYLYDEQSLRTIDDWSEEHDNAAERISEYARPSQEALTGDLIAPDLYKNLKAIVDDRVGGAENLPRRRIVLLVSDGKDASVKRERKMKRYTEGILEAARAHGVKLYTVGFSLDTTEHLVHLRTLANRSGGVYREVRPDEMDSIPQVLENIAIELKKQYIITFRPHDDYKGSEKPVKLRLKMEAPGGRILEDEYEARVRVGEKPFSWLRLLAIIGACLLGLFIIVMIFRGIRGMMAARRERVGDDGEPYVATYKGRLAVNSGPDVGEEFLLTEDSLTIGSVGGNDIVLSGAGVSKRHAGLKIDDMRFELTDFGSTNGTTVNGNPINKQFLKDGDEIGIGENTLRFTLK